MIERENSSKQEHLEERVDHIQKSVEEILAHIKKESKRQTIFSTFVCKKCGGHLTAVAHREGLIFSCDNIGCISGFWNEIDFTHEEIAAIINSNISM